MFTRINCCVHEMHYKECIEEVKKNDGMLSTIQPEHQLDNHFVEVEANFKNLNDANKFIYRMFFSFGLHFYVETMRYVVKAF